MKIKIYRFKKIAFSKTKTRFQNLCFINFSVTIQSYTLLLFCFVFCNCQ